MKVLITGGCGFIGSTLIKMLTEAGDQVTVYDNLSTGTLEYVGEYDGVAVVEGDIRDTDKLIESSVGHDAIIHLAAFGSVVDSVQSPWENFSVNAEGTLSTLYAAKENKVGKVVMASTGGALIGNATPPVNEESTPRPISPYGASKLSGEGYCCAFANSYGMNVTALRFANVIGPLSWHKKGAVTAFMKALLGDGTIKIYGDGSATRDFLYVDDLCAGFIAATRASDTGFNVYHLASGMETSVKELAEMILKVAGHTGHNIEYLPRRSGEVDRNFATYDLANSLLNFSPKYDLESALDATWKWYCAYSEELNR